jgi:5-methylcytosine-specific restriction endonuclease McrA
MTRALSVCSVPACPRAAEPGRRYCASHRALYDSSAWRRLRRQALERDGYACRVCGAPARAVHHVRPLLLGGLMLPTLDGLETRCATHHHPLEGVTLDRMLAATSRSRGAG